MWRSRLLLVLLLLLAGCAGLPTGPDRPAAAGSRDDGAGTVTPDVTTTDVTTGTTTRSPPATPQTEPVDDTPGAPAEPGAATTPSTASPTTTTTDPAPDNPWGTNPVVVAVDNEAGFAHEKYDLFRRALDYWEGNASRYAGADVEFTLDPDAVSPDVTIRYVEAIERCGRADPTENALGCAPLYRSGRAAAHTTVRLRATDDDVQLVETTKHEFGHVLGIGHGEEPMPLMAEDNLYLHASPWNRSAIRYYVDVSDKPGFSDAVLTEEVEVALRYFEDGADGHLSSAPSFRRVDRRSESNVVVAFHDDPRQGDGFSGSAVESFHEGTIEGRLYRRYTIALYDLDRGAMSWHVAYQLAGTFVTDEDSYPAALDPDECGYRCRRGDWWH